jgi:hypothetical protein
MAAESSITIDNYNYDELNSDIFEYKFNRTVEPTLISRLQRYILAINSDVISGDFDNLDNLISLYIEIISRIISKYNKEVNEVHGKLDQDKQETVEKYFKTARLMKMYICLKSDKSVFDEYISIDDRERKNYLKIRSKYHELLAIHLVKESEIFVDRLNIDESITQENFINIIDIYLNQFDIDKDELRNKLVLEYLLNKFFEKYPKKLSNLELDTLILAYKKIKSDKASEELLEADKLVARIAAEKVAKAAAKKAAKYSSAAASAEPESVKAASVEPVLAAAQESSKRKENILLLLTEKLARFRVTLEGSLLNRLATIILEFKFNNSEYKCNNSKCSGNTNYGYLQNMDRSSGRQTYSNPWIFIHRECLHSLFREILLGEILKSIFPITKLKINSEVDQYRRLQFYVNFNLDGQPAGISLHADGLINQSHLKFAGRQQRINFAINERLDLVGVKVDFKDPDPHFDLILDLLNVILLIFLFTFKFGKYKLYEFQYKYLKYKHKYLQLKKLLYN